MEYELKVGGVVDFEDGFIFGETRRQIWREWRRARVEWPTSLTTNKPREDNDSKHEAVFS